MSSGAQRTASRRARERDLVDAARKLFDERGMQDAPIEAIAREAGIARGLVYRHFSSKEELFVLTVTNYLDELESRLAAATNNVDDPSEGLRACAQAYAGYCLQYPAFLDCALALMRQPASELFEMVSESVWLRLGRGISACVDQLTRQLVRGVDQGVFELADPDFTANLLWTQFLGAMHLARIGVGMRRTDSGEPDLFRIPPEQVVEECVAAALAVGRPAPPS